MSHSGSPPPKSPTSQSQPAAPSAEAAPPPSPAQMSKSNLQSDVGGEPQGADVTGPSAVAGPSNSNPRRPSMAVNPAINGSSTSMSSAASSSNQVQQIGSRQGTRSRSRTTRKAPAAAVVAAAQQQQQQNEATNNAGDGDPTVPPSPSANGDLKGIAAKSRFHAAIPQLARYNSEDHPLSAHKLAARGYHAFSCLGVPFHVPKKYTFLRELGIGAYGCVALARDEEADMNVAIKKVTRVFERDVLARRALREVAVLRHLSKNQNCTALVDFDTTYIDFSEIYLVLSASEADLSQIIRSGQNLTDAHLQYFAAQLLRGVRYMHAANIVHRDLKPGNLLVNADCALFICDFGLARAFAGPNEAYDHGEDGMDSDAVSQPLQDGTTQAESQLAPMTAQDPKAPHVAPSPAMLSSPESPLNGRKRTGAGEPTAKDSTAEPSKPQLASAEGPRRRRPAQIQTARLDFPGGPVTEYVSTRWYRAPEIMLGFKEGYGTEIDMWSVGCILAELARGKPLFDGKDYVDQIARIHKVLGPPEQHVLDGITSERARVYVESLSQSSDGQTKLADMLPGASAGLLDLLDKLLIWDPKDRLSAADALKHPWLSAYHGMMDQWERPEPFSKFEEVELINTLPEFKAALQKESREVRSEYNALYGAQSDVDEDEDSRGEEETPRRTSSGSADDDADEGDDADNDVGDQDGEAGQAGAASAGADTMERGESRRSSNASTARLAGAGSRDRSTSSGSTRVASSPSSENLSTPLRRISETSSGASSDSYYHYTTDTGAASSPITSNAESSAAVSAASSTAGDLTLTSGSGARDKLMAGRHSLPAPFTRRDEEGSVSAFPASGGEGSKHGRDGSPSSGLSDAHDRMSRPRYRRRAISNAHRFPSLEEGGLEGVNRALEFGSAHSVSLNLDEVTTASAVAMLRRGSAGNDAGGGAADGSHVLPAMPEVDGLSMRGGQLSPPDPQDKIAPSPDFKSFTTDLIARPKTEVGAFSSPSLAAGDAFSQCVAAVTTMGGPSSSGASRASSRRGSHSLHGLDLADGSTSAVSATSPRSPGPSGAGAGGMLPSSGRSSRQGSLSMRRKSKTEEMSGLISAIRAEADKLRLSSLEGSGGGGGGGGGSAGAGGAGNRAKTKDRGASTASRSSIGSAEASAGASSSGGGGGIAGAG